MTPQEIESLLEARCSEGPRLEYKRELPGSTDNEKKEFLADVVAMANAGGGSILFGIEEEEGSAVDIVGVSASEESSQRLGNLIRDGIEPACRASLSARCECVTRTYWNLASLLATHGRTGCPSKARTASI
jgi:predicted HTH transcriptional regulator